MRESLVTIANPYGFEEKDKVTIGSFTDDSTSNYANYIGKSGILNMSSGRIAQFICDDPPPMSKRSIVISLIDAIPYIEKNHSFKGLLKDREGKLEL